MNEVFKNSVFRWREIEKLTSTTNCLLYGIQFQIRNRQHRCRNPFCASDESFNPSQKFSQVKWLAEIVIGPGVKEIYDRFFAFLCGENQDRSVKFSPPQILKNALATL